MSEAVQNLRYIQDLFQKTPGSLQGINNTADICKILNLETPKFRSIAFESASYYLASKDLLDSSPFSFWNQFHSENAGDHGFHIEIGLGWAIAKYEAIEQLVEHIPSGRIQYLAMDGYGYYNALFKGRSVLKKQEYPEIPHHFRPAFDQGMGRRLWYTSNANSEILSRYLSHFDRSRYPAIWRGLGIAVAYVGGIEAEDMEKLVNLASEFRKDFETGIQLSFMSRQLSLSLDQNHDRIANHLWQRVVTEKLLTDMVNLNTLWE